MTKRFCSRCGSRLPDHEPSCPYSREERIEAAWERKLAAAGEGRMPAALSLPSPSQTAPPVAAPPAEVPASTAVDERELQLIRQRLLEERLRLRAIPSSRPARKRRLVRAGMAASAGAALVALLLWSPWDRPSRPLAIGAEQTTTDAPEVAGVRDVRIDDEAPPAAESALDRDVPAREEPATGAGPAPARDPRVGSLAAARAEIRSTIGGYARAVESRDVRQLRRVYPRLTPEEETNWRQFFASVRNLKAELNVETLDVLDVASATAVVRVTGTYSYHDRTLERDQSSPVDFEATLRRGSGGWFFSSVR